MNSSPIPVSRRPVRPATVVSSRCLVVPQWQGWAVSDEQRQGALELAERFACFAPEAAIAAAPFATLQLEEGILGRAAILENLATLGASIRRRPARHLLTLGGDCSVDLAPIAYMNELAQGDLAVIWLDAHGDLNRPEDSTSHRFHGMPVRALLGAGDRAVLDLIGAPLALEQIFLVGARDLDAPEARFISDSGLTSLTVADVRARPGALVEAIAARGYRHVHVHLDFDVLDPGAFADLNTPVAGGLKIAEVTQLLLELDRHFDIDSATMTEYCPRGAKALVAAQPILAFFEALGRRWQADTGTHNTALAA